MNEHIENQPTLMLESLEEWTKWLVDHHETSRLVWLRIRKRKSKQPGICLSEAVTEAIRFGWIDGKVIRLDQDYFYLRFTPRKPKSVWSLINRNRAQAMIDAKVMTPSGIKTVENGKLSGMWQAAYSSFGNTAMPMDFIAMLDEDPKIHETFDHWNNSDKLQAVFWIDTAKTPLTRQKRIEKIVNLLKANLPLKVLSEKSE